MSIESKIFTVNLIESGDLIVSGKGESDLWKQSEVLTQFVSPWDANSFSRIEFRALWDKVNFFFCFTVLDTEIHIDKKDDSVDSIGNSDRVELFFRPDDTLNPYYCLEIDTDARIMDFIAYPNKKFNFDWNWPEGNINVKSSKNNFGFTVEGAISIASLNQLQLIKDGKIETGVFRAKYKSNDGLNFDPVWISWVDPQTETPNFHIASSFGLFQLKS